MAILRSFFLLQKLESFSLYERCSTALLCAGRTWMQRGMLAFTEASRSFQLLVLCTYTFHKAFFFLSKYANAAHAIPFEERQTDFQQSRLNTKGHSYGIVPPSEALSDGHQ